MNKEKLEYLRRNVTLSLLKRAKIALLKYKGVPQEEIDTIEYQERFNLYEKECYHAWESLNFKDIPDQSLMDFSNSALEIAISKEKKKIK